MGEFGPAAAAPPPTAVTGRTGPAESTEQKIVEEQLAQLEVWALDNRNDMRRDILQFWAFKLPALVGAASTSALEAFGYGATVIVFGVVSAICIGIDALRPRGLLYNVHQRAFNEIRNLEQSVQIRWRKAELETAAGSAERKRAVAAILDAIEAERTRIHEYITAAEAAVGVAAGAATGVKPAAGPSAQP